MSHSYTVVYVVFYVFEIKVNLLKRYICVERRKNMESLTWGWGGSERPVKMPIGLFCLKIK